MKGPKAGKNSQPLFLQLLQSRGRLSKTTKMKLLSELSKAIGAEKVSDSLPDTVLSRWPLLLVAARRGHPLAKHDLVVHPESTEEVSKVVKVAYRLAVPLIPWGAGSEVVGSGYPVTGGLLVDLSRMNRVLQFDEKSQLVSAEAGIRGDVLEDFLRNRGYTLGHVPQSLHISSLGGWIAAGSTGQFSTGYGNIEDMLHSIAAVLPNGKVVRLTRRPRSAFTPALPHIFVGSEGSIGIITEASLKVRRLPEKVVLESFVCESFEKSLEAVRELIQSWIRPSLVRAYDEAETRLRFGEFVESGSGCITLLVLEGLKDVVEAEHFLTKRKLEAMGMKFTGPQPVEKWLAERFEALKELEKYMDMGFLIETFDVAADWSGLHMLYQSMRNALLSVEGMLFVGAHASHFYETGGCLYFTVAGKHDDFLKFYSDAWSKAMEACLSVRGMITHQHGVGLARLPWLRKAMEDDVYVFEKIRKSLDPKGIMNPKPRQPQR